MVVVGAGSLVLTCSLRVSLAGMLLEGEHSETGEKALVTAMNRALSPFMLW